jgi:hypothetical protein
MASKRRVVVNPLTDEQRRQYERDQARERAKRGLPSFTRPERREAILGSTKAESGLGRTQRQSQATQRTDEARRRSDEQRRRSRRR